MVVRHAFNLPFCDFEKRAQASLCMGLESKFVIQGVETVQREAKMVRECQDGRQHLVFFLFFTSIWVLASA